MDIYRHFLERGLTDSHRRFFSAWLGRSQNYLSLRTDRGPSADALDELHAKGASLRVLEPSISTADALTGQIVITTLGLGAELERRFMLDRQRAGIQRRKDEDRGLPQNQRAYRGRRRTVDAGVIRQLQADGLGATAISKQLGVSRMSVYRALA